MHIGLGHDLGSVIEGTAKGSISIIRANGGAINSVLNGARQKNIASLDDASSKVITLTGRAVENTLLVFVNFSRIFGRH